VGPGWPVLTGSCSPLDDDWMRAEGANASASAEKRAGSHSALSRCLARGTGQPWGRKRAVLLTGYIHWDNFTYIMKMPSAKCNREPYISIKIETQNSTRKISKAFVKAHLSVANFSRDYSVISDVVSMYHIRDC